MNNDTGVLSIDFLTGFTIFMLAFIWVATMVPGLLIGLNAHTIDYDAVAYRTGVILVEDPGTAGSGETLPWEFQLDKRDVIRFGLAVSRETPNILNGNKVDRFFCSTVFSYPEDYQKRVIFGDYPYRFNISLKHAGQDQIHSVGEIVPDNYGYIRRHVKVKQASNATIDDAKITTYGYTTMENVSYHQFSIVLNTTKLVDDGLRSPAYQIDPFTDRIIINITDLEMRGDPSKFNPAPPSPSRYNLTAIHFYQLTHGQPTLFSWSPAPKYQNYLYEDGNTTAVLPPVDIRRNLTLIFEPGFFSTASPTSDIYINLTFGMSEPEYYLNNTMTGPFDYNYHPSNVTQPTLTDAVMEVAIW